LTPYYNDRHPNFDNYVWNVDGVRGEVRIDMDVDGNVTRVRRPALCATLLLSSRQIEQAFRGRL
jgi:hypothetical protein